MVGKRTTSDGYDAVQAMIMEHDAHEGAILVVDDQQCRAERLIDALDAPQFGFDYLSEVPDIEGVLGRLFPSYRPLALHRGPTRRRHNLPAIHA